MTVIAPPAAAGGHPFTRLDRELAELDFTTVDTGDDHTRTLRSTHSPTTVTLDLRPGIATACITHLHPDDSPGWQINLTADTPEVTQLVALYGALNPTPDSVIESIAIAYDIKPWRDGTQAAVATVG